MWQLLNVILTQGTYNYAVRGLLLKLITLRDSAYYEAHNKLLKLILLNCQKTKPSLRDRHKLKDIVLLIKSIVKNRSIIKWNLNVP